MSSETNVYRERPEKLIKTFSPISGRSKELGLSEPEPTSTVSLLANVANTIPTEEGGFGEDAFSQINIFVPDQIPTETDFVYFYNDTYDPFFTEYSTMFVYINGVPRSVVTFTSDRENTDFWYKIVTDNGTFLAQDKFINGEVFLTI